MCACGRPKIRKANTIRAGRYSHRQRRRGGDGRPDADRARKPGSSVLACALVVLVFEWYIYNRRVYLCSSVTAASVDGVRIRGMMETPA